MTLAPHIATETPAKDEHVGAVLRWVLIFGASLLFASIAFGDPRAQVGALLGSGLSLLNASLVNALSRRATVQAAAAPKEALSRLLFMSQLKLGLVGLLLFFGLRYLPAAPLWVLFGLSLLPLGIVARAIEHGVRQFRGGTPSTDKPPGTESEAVKGDPNRG